MPKNKINTRLVLVSICLAGLCIAELEIVHQWNLLDFHFPADSRFINHFKPESVFFTGLEITQDHIFLSIPRMYKGVPATLAVIPRNVSADASPKLQAYPDWTYHQAGRGLNFSCDGLVSVHRIKTDSCNRLWVLDSGAGNTLEEFRRLCPPKILIFNLTTNSLYRKITFPRDVYRPSSLFTNLVIDESIQGPCDSAFVYITDTIIPAIVVYDALTKKSWRWTHPSMYPDPRFSICRIHGEMFDYMDGIVGISYSPNSSAVYFQPFASDSIFRILTKFLRKRPSELAHLPVAPVFKKYSQSVGLAVNEVDETVYFGTMTETCLFSLNLTSQELKFISYDFEKLQFLSDVRWSREDGGCVWALSNCFNRFFTGALRQNETNLRILRACPNSTSDSATPNLNGI